MATCTHLECTHSDKIGCILKPLLCCGMTLIGVSASRTQTQHFQHQRQQVAQRPTCMSACPKAQVHPQRIGQKTKLEALREHLQIRISVPTNNTQYMQKPASKAFG